MKDSFRVAFCGLISALAVVLMLVTSIFPAGTYALPCFSGILLTAVVVEFGEKWAFGAYFAVAALSVLLAGDKEAAVYFTAFLGFYPILKSCIEKLRSKALQYVIKYAVFNVCIIAAFTVCKFVLAIPDEEFKLFGFYVPWAFLLLGEFVFFFYDKCVTILVYRYVTALRPKIFKK